MKQVTVVLIPNREGTFRGIGLMEPMWKWVKNTMDNQLQTIELHDCLHGFLVGRGTDTSTIKAKLT